MPYRFKSEDGAAASFPLGGIGTGSVSLSGNGRLIDWEIFHRPNRNSYNGFTNFAIKAEADGQVLDTRICQGDTNSDFMGGALSALHSWGYGNGVSRSFLAGAKHFRDVTFEGKFPVANVTYRDDAFPGGLSLDAYNPFIPSNSEDSSLPCGIFRWNIENTTDREIEYTVAFSCGNVFERQMLNRFKKNGNVSSIVFTSTNFNDHQARYGNIAISTNGDDVSYQESWYRSGWFDELTMFWNNFTAPGKLVNRHYEDPRPDWCEMATLCSSVKLQPGEKKTLTFVLSWYIPNIHLYWSALRPTEEQKKKIEENHWDFPLIKAYYTKKFGSSADVADYVFNNAERLYSDTLLFRDTLFGTSVPECVKDAVSGTVAILKSTTCYRLENGEFYAFEGVQQTTGSCEGSCDHVWNYQYALPFLFPDLERTLREIDYTYNNTPTGENKFRTMLPLGSYQWGFRACVDGQFGGVMKFYRDWKICGNDDWLRKYWPVVKKTIEYAWSPDNYDRWDPDKSGVLTGRQHHTLDMELFGPSSWLETYYLGALKAGAEIAEYLGETESAKEYREIFEKGKKWTEENLFNGKHYIQKVDYSDKAMLDSYKDAQGYWNDETKEMKYQFGDGCEIDQVVGQWHANLIGLGEILDSRQVRTALENLYRINFRSMRDVFNPCRVFAVDDEKGLIICNWDEGAYKPKIPIPYTEEVMTGFEYAAGDAMLMYGLEDKAIDVCASVRERYDGKKRNPWAEIECGASYSRSMASFSYLLTYSGYEFDMTKKMIGFNPIHPDDGYSTFWAIDGAWGKFEIKDGKQILTVLYGELCLGKFNTAGSFRANSVKNCGKPAAFERQGRTVTFASPVTLTRDCTLEIS